jgi:hypothetical protein
MVAATDGLLVGIMVEAIDSLLVGVIVEAIDGLLTGVMLKAIDVSVKFELPLLFLISVNTFLIVPSTCCLVDLV